MQRIQKILVPVDFSLRSADGLRHAASLAEEIKAELIVLHVFDKEESHFFLDRLASIEGRPVLPNRPIHAPSNLWFRERSWRLRDFIEKVLGNTRHLKIRRRVEWGDLAKKIRSVAKRERVNIVVLAVRRKSFLPRLRAGGQLLKFTARFSCPVLLAPPVPKERPQSTKSMLS